MNGILKNVILDINTNGTIFNDRLNKIAKHFKMVKLHISVEGTGKLFHIPGGDNFTIEQLEENIKLFNNFTKHYDYIYSNSTSI